MYKLTLTAGILIRGQMRTELARNFLTFTETKNFFQSVFTVTGLTRAEYDALVAWANRYNS